jgi:hypothetical protein
LSSLAKQDPDLITAMIEEVDTTGDVNIGFHDFLRFMANPIPALEVARPPRACSSSLTTARCRDEATEQSRHGERGRGLDGDAGQAGPTKSVARRA